MRTRYSERAHCSPLEYNPLRELPLRQRLPDSIKAATPLTKRERGLRDTTHRRAVDCVFEFVAREVHYIREHATPPM